MAQEFEQVSGTQLYEVRAAGSVGWAAYVLPAMDSPPASISYADSLGKYVGYYLFAVNRPPKADTDPAGLAADALAWFKGGAKNNRGAGWLKDPATASFGDFPLFGFAFFYDIINRVYPVTSNLNVYLGTTLVFSVLQQLRVTVDADAGALVLSGGQGSSLLIYRTKGTNGGTTLQDVGITVTGSPGPRTTIPFEGEHAASFVHQVTLKPSVTFSPAQGYPPQLRYAVRTSGSTADTILSYPWLDTAATLPASVSCTASVDPSDPTNERVGQAELLQGLLRTAFVPSGAPALPTFLRTAEGIAVSAAPVGTGDGAGALAVASSSPAGAQPGTAQVYLAPAGTFGLSVAGVDAGQPQQLLGGLFGSERLSFTTFDAAAAASDTLCFVPSQKGYAPVFPFEDATLDDPTSGGIRERLTDGYRAPWATVVGGAGVPQYSAEPEGSPLYGADASAGGEAPAVLPAAPPRMAVPQGTAHAFPLVPYGGAAPATDAAADTLTRFESQILSPTRKEVISAGATEAWAARASLRGRRLAATAAAPEDAGMYATTPQGLVARVDPATSAYLEVQFAQSTDEKGAEVPFAISDPTLRLQDALQTNQLFLVAVDPEFVSGGGATFRNTLFVVTGTNPLTGLNDVWRMTADVGSGASPTSYRNVMIMKFCSGSLQERVTNPNQWTAPRDFSLVQGADAPGLEEVAFTGLSQWLQAYILDGISRATGASAAFYRNFKKIVTDPDWNGVIVLQASLSTEDLPQQIRGLAAGIDFTRFTAHHFGFSASRVKVDGGVVAMDGDSAVFGLIDYEEPAYEANLAAGVDPMMPVPVATSGAFQFTVLQLQCLFENARLRDFRSRIQLTVDELFGSDVSAAYVGGARLPANAVVLDGSYVDQNGTASYVFQTDRTTVLALSGNTLLATAFSRVQFNTLGPRDDGATTASRFLVWGALDFAELKAADGSLLDVLSFGSQEGTPAPALGAGLAFSNLVIGMSFPTVTPSAKTFAVDTDTLAWDLPSSTSREASLFRGFGLQLRSFVNAAGGSTPADFGFLPVTSELNLETLDGPWFGVVCEVTLGGPGALASSAGFSSNLLLAWAPTTKAGDEANAVFLGLSLPGAAPGAKLFSLQGVFKVGVGSIALLRQVIPGSDPEEEYYCLRLDDIGIRIFGIVKLPPAASIQFFLFGDPDRPGSLAWYAAYVAKDNPDCDQQAALASPMRRALPFPAERDEVGR